MSIAIDKEIENLRKMFRIGLGPISRADNHLSLEADLKYLEDMFNCLRGMIIMFSDKALILKQLEQFCDWLPISHGQNEIHAVCMVTAIANHCTLNPMRGNILVELDDNRRFRLIELNKRFRDTKINLIQFIQNNGYQISGVLNNVD